MKRKPKIDVIILTPTYNRGAGLASLIEALALQGSRASLRIIHVVVNDASTRGISDYRRLEAQYLAESPYAVLMRWNQSNNGVKGFWKTINKLFELARGYDFPVAYMIQDDAVPCDNFFQRTQEMFAALKKRDKSICAMNIVPSMLASWGTSRYLDGFYMVDKRFFDALKWQLYEPQGDWADNFASGSGVGMQITRRIGQSKVSIAPNQDVSWLNVIEKTSVMFPKRKAYHEWARRNFVDRPEELVQCQ